jgi:ATP synthase protein I|tara:strand:+ start:1745 stop:1999 length:255 start_codon:yes stop_codon:yes gene_type:complete
MTEDFDKKLDEMSTKYGLKEKEVKQEENQFSGLAVGLSLFSHILVGMFLGYWIDKAFDSTPWAMISFLFLGFIAGFRHMWQQMK